jgi:hypothetical protein
MKGGEQMAGKAKVANLNKTEWERSGFDPSVEGVGSIGHDSNTEVPADKEDAVRAAAKSAGVSITISEQTKGGE